MTEKTIDTLVDDIYSTLDNGISLDDLDDALLESLGKSIAASVKTALSKEERTREPTLRMSNIGKACNRQLYYEINSPEDKESLPPAARLKFLFGHILEDLLLYLAEVSGHRVEGRQDEVEIEGIKGHRDAVIDGVVVDVKSASTYSFNKFKNHELSSNDPFGYLDQIESYRRTGESDDLVTDKERCAFLAVDKTLGNICLDIWPARKFPIEKLYQYKKEMVDRPEPPSRAFNPIPEGKSGNMKLGVNCSYCDFKNKCYPNLRTFVYAKGPVFLTKVVKEPNVPEFTGKEGQGEVDTD